MFNLTTKNTTVLGIIMIVQALLQAALAVFDGDVATVVDFQSLVAAFVAGVALIKVQVETPS